MRFLGNFHAYKVPFLASCVVACQFWLIRCLSSTQSELSIFICMSSLCIFIFQLNCTTYIRHRYIFCFPAPLLPPTFWFSEVNCLYLFREACFVSLSSNNEFVKFVYCFFLAFIHCSFSVLKDVILDLYINHSS